MTTALVIVAAVLVILALSAALADRVCATLAERKASEYLTAPFGHPPTVRVHGTRSSRRRCAGDIATSPSPAADSASARSRAPPSTRICTTRSLPLRELLGGRATELPCERVEGRLVLPYGEVARVSRDPGPGADLRTGPAGRLGVAADSRARPGG